jgi:8-oxo-dGTP pyrophosphatase MutT (NUDIX family)
MASRLVLSILLLPCRCILPGSSLSSAVASGGAPRSRAAARSDLPARQSSSTLLTSFVMPPTGRGVDDARGGMMPSPTSADASIAATATKGTMSCSLASDYSIRIRSSRGEDELRWELLPLSRWEGPNLGVGAIALRALSDDGNEEEGGVDAAVCCTLSCKWSRSSVATVDPQRAGVDGSSWPIHVKASVKEGNERGVSVELVCILARVMAQSAASEIARLSEEGRGGGTRLLVMLPLSEGEGCQELHLSDLVDDDVGVRRLFASMNDPGYSEAELVDMVDREGRVLGSLPRPYVHAWNILHRGVGLIVAKDEGASSRSFEGGRAPMVYVHRRTSTKRIFPSLYDMFVGGVSCRGEGAKMTAAREVAEELGLRRAMDFIVDEGGEEMMTTRENDPLSDELFKCIVCTAYNRCVVSMFTYTTCDGENISWQEEEVAWGNYVPYKIVELAADASVDRLVKRGDWPGSDRGDDIAPAPAVVPTWDHGGVSRWDTWDFVPDGLLVWEAWKSYARRR